VFRSSSVQRLLIRLGRWPRRLAALACLLLAAGSALVPDAARAPAPRAAGLRSGEVAVPVPVQNVGEVKPGRRVGVLAPPEQPEQRAVLVADRLRVVSVRSGGSGADAEAVVVVATDRAAAIQLARYATRPLLMIVDDLP
jgi:hypothetical protein